MLISRMRSSESPNRARGAHLLLAPGLLLYALLFAAPLALLVMESLQVFTPGRVGSVGGAGLTTANYGELFHPSFALFFAETFGLSLLATLIGIVVAFPLSYRIACRYSRRARILAIVGLTSFMFLSIIVKTYALELSFGSVGPIAPFLNGIGVSANSRGYIQLMVVAGLLQFVIPIATLTLVGTHQNIDRHLVEAAQVLGSTAWKAHLSITLPLAMPGVLSASLIAFSFGISAFIIPMILGKGRVLFLSNLIYNRFSETANYPSGASISIMTLIVSVIVVYAFSRWISTARRREGS